MTTTKVGPIQVRISYFIGHSREYDGEREVRVRRGRYSLTYVRDVYGIVRVKKYYKREGLVEGCGELELGGSLVKEVIQ